MGGEQAAGVLLAVKRAQLAASGATLSPDEEQAMVRPILEVYERESSAFYASARLWDDGIIDPADTRDVLGLALAVVHRVPVGPPKHGVLRM
jgi:acetyl-CoA carboxylase carboxyltransferase component